MCGSLYIVGVFLRNFARFQVAFRLNLVPVDLKSKRLTGEAYFRGKTHSRRNEAMSGQVFIAKIFANAYRRLSRQPPRFYSRSEYSCELARS